jgi:4'-phosphopantetheinyl transferase EntD
MNRTAQIFAPHEAPLRRPLPFGAPVRESVRDQGRDGMMAKILPPGVALCDRPQDALRHSLHPAERAWMDALPGTVTRKRQFEMGRNAARAAIRQLDFGDMPLLALPSGAPAWPMQLIGSITHCGVFTAAAVARSRYMAAIGIDAAAWRDFPTDGPVDLQRSWEIEAMQPTIDMRLKLCVLMSAKQSIFKALSPHIGRDFDPDSVTLKVDFAERCFRIVSADSYGLDIFKSALTGQFSVTQGVVLTSAVVRQ